MDTFPNLCVGQLKLLKYILFHCSQAEMNFFLLSEETKFILVMCTYLHSSAFTLLHNLKRKIECITTGILCVCFFKAYL